MSFVKNQNSLFSLITFITSLGDYISLFAVLYLIHNFSGNAFLAAYAVPVKSLGVAVAGATFPWVASRFHHRNVMIFTQFVCFILMSIIGIMSIYGFSTFFALLIFFFQSIFKQYFDNSREHASKNLGEFQDQRKLQAQILQGLYSAQFIGPILSFFLIRYLPISIPIWIDSLTFLVAAILSMFVSVEEKLLGSHSIFAPFKYLGSNAALLKIFLLRSIGYWVPIGVFNYLLFIVIQDHYGAKIESSAWVYSIIGFGSMVATMLLRSNRIFIHLTDGSIAFFSLIVLAFTRIGFLNLPSIYWAIVILAIGGICNGCNAVATQSLRRKLTTSQQFPEIIGLELVVGKFVDWLVATICAVVVANNILSYGAAIWASAVFLIVLGVLHLNKSLRV